MGQREGRSCRFFTTVSITASAARSAALSFDIMYVAFHGFSYSIGDTPNEPGSSRPATRALDPQKFDLATLLGNSFQSSPSSSQARRSKDATGGYVFRDQAMLTWRQATVAA